MSNIGELKTAVFDYLGESNDAIVDTTLQLGGSAGTRTAKMTNLFMIAANNARVRAERKHDFSFADVAATGTIPSSGAGLAFDDLTPERDAMLTNRFVIGGTLSPDATGTVIYAGTENGKGAWSSNGELTGTDEVEWTIVSHNLLGWTMSHYSLGVLDGAWAANNGSENYPDMASGWAPVAGGVTETGTPTFTRYTSPFRLKTVHGTFYKNTVTDLLVPIRFTTKKRLSDLLIEHLDRRSDEVVTYDRSQIICQGRRFYTFPDSSEDVDLRVDCTRWLPTYYLDTDEDEFLIDGFEYMLWATVCQLNKLTKTFVIQQDGNLPPPTDARDQALEEMIRLDVASTEENQNLALD